MSKGSAFSAEHFSIDVIIENEFCMQMGKAKLG
jgi:hypothetical protein